MTCSHLSRFIPLALGRLLREWPMQECDKRTPPLRSYVNIQSIPIIVRGVSGSPYRLISFLQHIDLDFTYTDTISMSLSTSLLLNYPTALFARLPISLTLSLSIFSGTVRIAHLYKHTYFLIKYRRPSINFVRTDNPRSTLSRIAYLHTSSPTKLQTFDQTIVFDGISRQTR